MTDMNNDLVQQLEDTIDVLQGEGWQRHIFNTYDKAPHCLLGAWSRANSGSFPRQLFIQVTGESSVTGWNDGLANDKYEVIAVLLTMRNIAYREAQKQRA